MNEQPFEEKGVPTDAEIKVFAARQAGVAPDDVELDRFTRAVFRSLLTYERLSEPDKANGGFQMIFVSVEEGQACLNIVVEFAKENIRRSRLIRQFTGEHRQPIRHARLRPKSLAYWRATWDAFWKHLRAKQSRHRIVMATESQFKQLQNQLKSQPKRKES